MYVRHRISFTNFKILISTVKLNCQFSTFKIINLWIFPQTVSSIEFKFWHAILSPISKSGLLFPIVYFQHLEYLSSIFNIDYQVFQLSVSTSNFRLFKNDPKHIKNRVETTYRSRSRVNPLIVQ
jgi:hypothetical protein